MVACGRDEIRYKHSISVLISGQNQIKIDCAMGKRCVPVDNSTNNYCFAHQDENGMKTLAN